MILRYDLLLPLSLMFAQFFGHLAKLIILFTVNNHKKINRNQKINKNRFIIFGMTREIEPYAIEWKR